MPERAKGDRPHPWSHGATQPREPPIGQWARGEYRAFRVADPGGRRIIPMQHGACRFASPEAA